MKIVYDGQLIDCDEQFSQKDFTGRSRVEIPNGAVVYASCFSQETLDSDIFPEGMKDVKFYNCNLDNVFIPDGNEVISCSQKRFKAQNDLNDWLVDEKGDPTKPVNYSLFEKMNLPLPNPNDIPVQLASDPIDLIKVAQEKADQ